MTAAAAPVDLTAGWTPKPGASAAWLNPAGLMIYPAIYGAHWTLRYPDGTEAHRYTLAEALALAAGYRPMARYVVERIAGIPIDPVTFTAPADATTAELERAAVDALVAR